MKKLLYILVIYFIPYLSYAQTRSNEELYAIANSILNTSQQLETKSNRHVSELRSKNIKLLWSYNDSLSLLRNIDRLQEISSDINIPNIYIFGYENGMPGYVILSACEQSHPLLAFSKDEDIDISNIPEAALDLLQMYDLRSDNNDLSSQNLNLPISNKSSVSSSVEPLLGEIKYRQGNPYNILCPTLNGSLCLLGCWPTALAEVMAYYKFPQRMNSSLGDISFTTKTYGISASWNCSNTIFDWNNICDTYINYAPIKQVSADNRDILSFLGFGHSDKEDKVQLNYITNISGTAFTGELQLLLSDKHGNFITTAGEATMIEDFPSRSKYKKLDINITIPQSLKDEEYRIYFAAKPKGAQKWSLVRCAKSDAVEDRYDTSTFVDEFIVIQKNGNSFSYDGSCFICGYDETQRDAISILCGACAYAAHSDFGNTKTPASSSDAIYALVNYMNYSSKIRWMKPEYFEPIQWHSYIQEELDSHRPLLISGKSESGGHAFIIDGYQYVDGIPYYHVNWGWNGKSNGYFLLDYLKPSEAGEGGYEENYGEYINVFSHVQPSEDNNFVSQLACTSISLDKSEYSEEEKIQIKMQDLSNRTFKTVENGELYVYLVDDFGADFLIGKIMNIPELKFCYSYKELNKSIKIPSTIPTGNYIIDLRLFELNSPEFSHVQSPSTIKLTVTNNTSCANIYNDKQNNDKWYDLLGRRVEYSQVKKIIVTKGKKIMNAVR